MHQVIENSVYTLRSKLNTLKQDAHRIEERLKLANEEVAAATAEERLAKQCYHLTCINGKSTSTSCSIRLANASGRSAVAISASIMAMAERAANFRAQNDLAVLLAQFDLQEQQQTV